MDLAPMLATSTALPADAQGWAFEVKWDGVRALARIDGEVFQLRSRNGRDITHSYPELTGLRQALGTPRALLDGEIVAFGGGGRPDFSALQRRMHVADPAKAARLAQTTPVTYVVFDLLELDGRSLVELPYEQRRELLTGLDVHGPSWTTPPIWTRASVQEVLDATASMGLEGVVAKRLRSRYEPGRRSPDWRKVKHQAGQEVVVGGWTEGTGGRSGDLGALIVGVYADAGLRHAGRVGTGFDTAERARLLAALRPLARPTSPFVDHTDTSPAVHWVEPQLVVQVGFGEWTPTGKLRHPTYQGRRPDKQPGEVVQEP